MGAAPAEKQSAGDNRQHAGSMRGIRRQIDRLGNQNAEDDLDGAIVDPAFDKVDDPADQQAECYAAENKPQQR